MSKFTVHAGHAADGNLYSGAVGLCRESVENRKIKDSVIKYLRMSGHEVYDCTVDSGRSQSAVISEIKKKINSYNGVTANISIHLNSYNGSAYGTECLVYSWNSESYKIADRICTNVSSLGFVNRGKKIRTDLGVLKGITNGGANILVETFFCDSTKDYNLYKDIGADDFGKKIAEAVLNKKINSNSEIEQAKVQLYDNNATDAQLWKIIHNSDGTIGLMNKACGLMLDVEGGSVSSGALVRVYKANGSKAQKFKLKQYDGYVPSFVAPVMIVPYVNETLRVECAGGGKENGTRIQTFTNNSSSAQKWTVIDNGDGHWRLINTGSMKALDVSGGGV